MPTYTVDSRQYGQVGYGPELFDRNSGPTAYNC